MGGAHRQRPRFSSERLFKVTDRFRRKMSHLSTSKVKFPSAVTEGSAITGKLTGGNIIAAPHFLLLSCSFLSAASRRRFSPLFLFRDKARGEGPCSYICLKWARSGSNKEEVTAIPEVCRCDIRIFMQGTPPKRINSPRARA